MDTLRQTLNYLFYGVNIIISGGWNIEVPLYTEVSSFQDVGGVLIEGSHCIQRCPHFRRLEYRGPTVYRGVLISGGWNIEVPLYTDMSLFQEE